ncbi:hypothetical protein [Chitinivorax sp. B]|uniref:hypothetical protein n=1 Tax=Chitinivorax sp. B TaxID=2502235 RepID=UPI0010F9011D|nr:hypothetical protein [Chitinivorax sp. B]
MNSLTPIEVPDRIERVPAAGIQSLRIDANILGNLLLCFDAEYEIELAVSAERHLQPAKLKREGSTLYYRAGNLWNYLFYHQSRPISVQLCLPRHIRVEAHFLAGVLTLQGGDGALIIHGGIGEVTGYTCAQHVDVRLRCGDISLSHLPATAMLRVGIGAISLDWAMLEGNERIDAQCGLGGIDLYLPPGTAASNDQHHMWRHAHITSPQGSQINARLVFGGLAATMTH